MVHAYTYANLKLGLYLNQIFPLHALHTCPEWEIECGRKKIRDKMEIQNERFYFSNWICFLGDARCQKIQHVPFGRILALFFKKVDILTLNDFLFQIFFQGKNFLCHLAVKSCGDLSFHTSLFYNRAQPTFSRTTKSIKSFRPH